MDKLSYALGLNIGRQLQEMGLKDSLNIDDYRSGIADALHGNQPQIGSDEANRVLADFFTAMEERQKAEAANRGAAARKDGEQFLSENAKRAGVIITPSGLQYEVLQEGNGRKPSARDTVSCHYEGTLIDGTVFDSSYQRGVPAEFGLQQVIAGWTEGVQLMSEGAKYKFYIPWQLAYGEHGAGNAIPPYAALIFTVELLKVK